MKTAFTAPLAPLLERLYEEPDAESPTTSPAVTELSLEERTRLMQSKTDYLALFRWPRKIGAMAAGTFDRLNAKPSTASAVDHAGWIVRSSLHTIDVTGTLGQVFERAIFGARSFYYL